MSKGESKGITRLRMQTDESIPHFPVNAFYAFSLNPKDFLGAGFPGATVDASRLTGWCIRVTGLYQSKSTYSRSINGIKSVMIKGPDDGRVLLERTRVAGMNAHTAVPVSHPFLMKRRPVIDLTVHFLKHGSFTPQSGK